MTLFTFKKKQSFGDNLEQFAENNKKILLGCTHTRDRKLSTLSENHPKAGQFLFFVIPFRTLKLELQRIETFKQSDALTFVHALDRVCQAILSTSM